MGQKEDAERLRELEVLEALVENPEARQADLATRLGVAVGTVNWLLKRLVSKGYVKVKRIGQWRWRYLLTPQGFAEKARLTQQYLQNSMRLYRQTRHEARRLLNDLRRRGYTRVLLEGDTENALIDICRLTCLEQEIAVVSPGESSREDGVPALRVVGQELFIEWPKESKVANQGLGSGNRYE